MRELLKLTEIINKALASGTVAANAKQGASEEDGGDGGGGAELLRAELRNAGTEFKKGVGASAANEMKCLNGESGSDGIAVAETNFATARLEAAAAEAAPGMGVGASSKRAKKESDSSMKAALLDEADLAGLPGEDAAMNYDGDDPPIKDSAKVNAAKVNAKATLLGGLGPAAGGESAAHDGGGPGADAGSRRAARMSNPRDGMGPPVDENSAAAALGDDGPCNGLAGFRPARKMKKEYLAHPGHAPLPLLVKLALPARRLDSLGKSIT